MSKYVGTLPRMVYVQYHLLEREPEILIKLTQILFKLYVERIILPDK